MDAGSEPTYGDKIEYPPPSLREETLKSSKYDQEIPQSQTADNPMVPRGRAAQPSRDTRKTN